MGKFVVYKDPEFDEETEEVIIGSSGPSILDTGFVFAPYVPIQIYGGSIVPPNSPLEDLAEGVFAEEIESGEIKPLRSKAGRPPLVNPGDFTLNPSIRKNYAKKLVKPEYFGETDITNL